MSPLFMVFIYTILSVLALQVSAQRTRPSDDVDPNVIYYSTQNYTEGSEYERFQKQAIDAAISNYTGQIFQVGTVYSMAECYNNNDCPLCLRSARTGFKAIAPLSIGGRYFFKASGYSCYLRFEDYYFGIIYRPPPAPGSPAGSPASAPPPVNEIEVDSHQFLSNPTSSFKFSNGLLVGALVGGLASSSVCVLLLWFCIRRRRRRRRRPVAGDSNLPVVHGAFRFGYRELETATSGFNESNKLGQGAFGTVYKGTLKDGSFVAVKQLELHSKQGQREFLNEISIITNIQHRNLVKLKGYCIDEDDRMVVYEYLPNKSLDKVLFGDVETVLDWPARMQIITGIANGLTYLHEQSQQGIIHRDIKASNILLDDKFQPKISDFGISKLFNLEQEFTNTVIAGTFGYLAPEYLQGGRLTTKADVYSFGVLTLEIVSGRKCIAPETEPLLRLTWRLEGEGQASDIIDKKLESSAYSEEILRVVHVALACTLDDPSQRPSMSQAVVMLAGYKEVPVLPRQYMSQQAVDLKVFSDTSSSSQTNWSSSLTAR